MSNPSSFRPERDIPSLGEKVVIVTGGNVGLGLETVRQLAKHKPARTYLACRSEAKAEAAINHLGNVGVDISRISFLSLDLSSFESIKSAVATFKKTESRLDLLINNAGIMTPPEGLTQECYEIQFGTNHMGHALLIQLLLPVLEHTAKINNATRVVTLSSDSHRLAPSDAYNFNELKTTMSNRHTYVRYCISKLANIHYTSAIAERHGEIQFVSVHPGLVATNLHDNSTGTFLKPFLNILSSVLAKPVEQGALNQLWAAVSPDVKTGEFYSPIGVPGKGSKASQNRELREELWRWTQEELRPHL